MTDQQSFDDKLKEIVYDLQIAAQNDHHNWEPDELESALNTEASNAITQIKQAFADDIGEMLEVQGTSGNWDYDPYMHGMYNGMEFCHSLIKGVGPKYKDAPDEWLTSTPAMTGQEWYTAFEKELPDGFSDIKDAVDQIMKAAKKAAGLDG